MLLLARASESLCILCTTKSLVYIVVQGLQSTSTVLGVSVSWREAANMNFLSHDTSRDTSRSISSPYIYVSVTYRKCG